MIFLNLNQIKKNDIYSFIRKEMKESMQRKDIGKVFPMPKDNNIDTQKIYSEVMSGVRQYVRQMSENDNIGKFSTSSNKANLYSYVYLAMLYGLLDIPYDESLKKIMIQNILDAQSEDGLFYDKNILNYEYLIGDGWGARHIIPHIIIAMKRLNIKPVYEFRFLSAFSSYDMMYALMDSLDWKSVWRTSNLIMNIGVCLQYERDNIGIKGRENGIRAIQDWLLMHVREDSGMWYDGKIDSRAIKYEMVRGAYHLYPILFYDGIDIPYMEKAIDIILSLQNKYGGFDFRKNSSACEDIDAIEPLIRLAAKLPEYRKEEVKKCLRNALFWIKQNQMPDGGFVFRKGELFNYGNINVASKINESNLFATWFRTLSVCYIVDYLMGVQHNYVQIPGYEYPLRNRDK